MTFKNSGKTQQLKSCEIVKKTQIRPFSACQPAETIRIGKKIRSFTHPKKPSTEWMCILIQIMLDQLPNSRLNLCMFLSKVACKMIEKMACSTLDRNCTQKVKKLVLSNDGTDTEGSSGITAQVLISLSLFNWNNLIELNMWNNKLGAKGCKFLSMASLPKLQTLDLGNNQIDSNGVLHLSKASFGELIELDLSVNAITTESVHWLIRSNQRHLKKIWIRKNKIPFNEILKFVLEGRKIGHLSVCKSKIIEDENEIDKCNNARLDHMLHQKFGDANINA